METKKRKPSLVKIGFVLVVASYALWAPTVLFLALAVGARAWLWCRLAVGTYAFSWVLLVAGFVVAGPDVARLGRRWIAERFRRKPALNPDAESAVSQ